MQFRKKPVVVEAWPFKADDPSTHSCPVTGAAVVNFSEPRTDGAESGLDNKYWIGTLEGPLVVSEGDIIIRGVKGEYYPCKPDIFAATYVESVRPTRYDARMIDEAQGQRIVDIKAAAEALAALIELMPGRNASVALTNLETAVFHAVRQVAVGAQPRS